MSGQDLINSIERELDMLDACCVELKKRGKNKAKTEYEYKTALSKKMLEERENGIPVTILSDICRGKPDIAKLKMERDIAETLYDSCKEGINATKLRIRIMEGQIDREYRG